MIPVGEPVLDFTLPGVHGDREGRWSLSDLRGRWRVLFFYPADFTFVCPTEVMGFHREREAFSKLGVAIFGISVDSVESHRAWARELQAEGLPRENAYRVVRLLQPRPEIILHTYHEKVLGLGRAELNRPIQAALVMGASFTVGSIIPLVPYVLATGQVALPVSVAVSTVTLFGVGVFKGVLARKSPWLSGLEFFAIALGSAALGYGLGLAINALSG